MKSLNITPECLANSIDSVTENSPEGFYTITRSDNEHFIYVRMGAFEHEEGIYTLEEGEGNLSLIQDAFKVVNEYGFTPSMLITERQTLLDNAKFTHDSMAEVLGSEYSLAEIVSQRKIFLSYLKDARTILAANITDPATERLDPTSEYYEFIKLLDTLID